MAKSERRSRWKRKFRAIRREKNEKKKTLILETILQNKSPGFVQIPPRKTNEIEVDENEQPKDEESMALDRNCDANIYNSKTKLNSFGNYPPWMNQRSVKKLKKRLKPSSAKLDPKSSGKKALRKRQ